MIIHDQKYECFSSEEFQKIQATNAAHSSRENVVARARFKGDKGGGKPIKIDKLTRGSGVEMRRALACLLTLPLREMNGQIDGQTETDRDRQRQTDRDRLRACAYNNEKGYGIRKEKVAVESSSYHHNYDCCLAMLTPFSLVIYLYSSLRTHFALILPPFSMTAIFFNISENSAVLFGLLLQYRLKWSTNICE